MESCLQTYQSFVFLQSIVYCNATDDGFLCWPPTIAGHTVTQNCPAARLSDSTRQAFRICDNDGLWLGRRANDSNKKGWTNYTPCFPTEVQRLLAVVDKDENSQEKFDIALNTRYLETLGFSCSLLALLVSLFIFSYFKSLHNTRTNIHRNLFSAMTIQVVIRLILYTDQAIVREHPDMSVQGLGGMPYLCQTSYILLEYAISSMFMWMFIEGLFLHSVVTANVLRERFSSTLFLFIGWGLPMIGTIAWAVATAIHFKDEMVAGCWFGYNFLPGYWILQGPRLTVVLINFFFLLRIMRVLITKLNATESNETTKVKKAAKAALVLLPLLGITNILNMIQPLSGPVWKFAIWSYFTHGLRSLQGFFISVIYCFSNAEVNAVLSKTYRDRIEERKDAERRERNATAQRRLRSRWWYICMEAVRTPIGKAYSWLRNLCSTPNTEQDVEIAMVTFREETQRRNYADPYFQSCMEELRIENDKIIVTSND